MTLIIIIFECLGVLLLSGAGVFAGYKISKLKRTWWLWGFVLPLSLILTIAFARRIPELEFSPPFSWLMYGRLEFIIFCFFAPLNLIALSAKMPHKAEKVIVYIFTGLMILYFSSPFYLPLLLYHYYSNLETRISKHGVCLQNNNFTCGPAAAVTALNALGVKAEEGELSILAHTTPITGSPPDSLSLAIEKLYGDKGISCDYKYFNNISEIETGKNTITLVLMDYSMLADHYVAVFEIKDNFIIFGDPLAGKSMLKAKEFTDMWQNTGIVIKRSSL